jgi:L-cysteine S-thiosulfotransferase
MRRAVFLFVATMVAANVAVGREIPREKRLSGYDQMSPATRAMQDDDTANPATFWVLDGEALWNTKDGHRDRSCSGCHGDAAVSMKGTAARYPAYDADSGTALNLEGRINLCRTKHVQAPAFAYESKELLALTTYIARQSRGLSIAEPETGLNTAIDAGRAIWRQRQGQLNLSCAQCHDDNWGQKLAGSTIPQGHPTGYPVYRLEWQTVGSLHRRLRNCLTGMRAENYAAGSPELVALEAFLMWRARGMRVDSPGVRP